MSDDAVFEASARSFIAKQLQELALVDEATRERVLDRLYLRALRHELDEEVMQEARRWLRGRGCR